MTKNSIICFLLLCLWKKSKVYRMFKLALMGKYTIGGKMVEKNEIKKNAAGKVAEKMAKLLTKELKQSANSAGSAVAYQPKAPAGLERFRK